MSEDKIELHFVQGTDEYQQAIQSRKPPNPTLQQYGVVGLFIIVGTVLVIVILDRFLNERLQVSSVFVGGIMAVEYARWKQRQHLKHSMAGAARQFSKQGVVQVVFDARGMMASSKFTKSEALWPMIDDILPARTCTVIHSGTTVLAIPDEALPSGLTKAAFVTQLTQWKSAS